MSQLTTEVGLIYNVKRTLQNNTEHYAYSTSFFSDGGGSGPLGHAL